MDMWVLCTVPEYIQKKAEQNGDWSERVVSDFMSHMYTHEQFQG